MSKPTLTIAVPCPTCGGTKVATSIVLIGTYPYSYSTRKPCPDCTDGTIRQAVNCAGCRFYDDGDCLNMCTAMEEWNHYQSVDPNFGCLSWEGPE